jgi:Raf kinase inhibitor-like YbhB/YbcL family protein
MEIPMQLVSNTLRNGAPLPAQHAMGIASGSGPVPGRNLSPQLAWSGAPSGTRSFVVTCIDPDAPARADDANKADRTIPADFPRAEFVHWLLADISSGTSELPEGVDGAGITPRGKPASRTDFGVRGLNNYTQWFAGDANMEGAYAGYDGAWPPFNDARPHRYVYTVHALSVDTLGLAPGFTYAALQAALDGHVLESASITCSYSLNAAR